MTLDYGVMLAALGMTLLELSEASAVGVAIYAETRSFYSSLGPLIAGEAIVLAPTFVAGNLIARLPVLYVRLAAATLLLYFGLRIARSARRTVLRSRRGAQTSVAAEISEGKGLSITAFSVGLTEALEDAIVLVALLPESYGSATMGFIAGVAIVAVLTYFLKEGVSRIRVALLKVFVSSMLLTFSAFWYAESVTSVPDVALLPLFAVAFASVYAFAYRY
ncbi:MAG: hypothetical protein ACP5FT_04590 [Acidilobus sp.]